MENADLLPNSLHHSFHQWARPWEELRDGSLCDPETRQELVVEGRGFGRGVMAVDGRQNVIDVHDRCTAGKYSALSLEREHNGWWISLGRESGEGFGDSRQGGAEIDASGFSLCLRNNPCIHGIGYYECKIHFKQRRMDYNFSSFGNLPTKEINLQPLNSLPIFSPLEVGWTD